MKSNLNWEKSLISLTAGGSEFVDDPEYCVKYVKDIQASQHKKICELTVQKKELSALCQELFSALDMMYETAAPYDVNPHKAYCGIKLGQYYVGECGIPSDEAIHKAKSAIDKAKMYFKK